MPGRRAGAGPAGPQGDQHRPQPGGGARARPRRARRMPTGSIRRACSTRPARSSRCGSNGSTACAATASWSARTTTTRTFSSTWRRSAAAASPTWCPISRCGRASPSGRKGPLAVEVESRLTDRRLTASLKAPCGVDRIVTERARPAARAAPPTLPPCMRSLSDPRAMLYWSTPPHSTLDETRAWLELDDRRPARRTRTIFIVEHERPGDRQGGLLAVPDIGFILHPDFGAAAWPGRRSPRIVPRLFERFPSPHHRRRRSPQSRLPDAAEGTGLRGDRSGGADLADRRDLVRQHLSRAAAPRTRLTSVRELGSLRAPLGRR